MKKENEMISFSETDSNGNFREAYGYFEKRNTGSQSERVEKMRNRISSAPKNSKMCNPDSHDFTRIDEFTGGIKYKCRKCGLEVVRYNCSYELDLAFLGSYVDNCSYKWHPDEMDASKIKKIQISFGDYPSCKIKCDDETSFVTYENTINGSRDGGGRYPNGFFDQHRILLSDEQKKSLFKALRDVDFSDWKTDNSTIRNMNMGSCGFCVKDSIKLLFDNGRSFVCYSCGKYSDFRKIATALIEICNLKFDECIENENEYNVISCCGRIYPSTMQFCSVCGKKLNENVKKSQGSILGFKTPCCNAEVPDYCNYCPKCGCEISNKEMLVHAEIEYDFEQTSWLCECLSSNAFSDNYCRNCGKKSPFQGEI